MAEKIVFVPVPEDDFIERVGEAVYKRILQQFSAAKSTYSEWLSHEEAAEYLKTTTDALYSITSKRKIKYSKRGKRNYYRIQDLSEYLAAGILKTKAEVQAEAHLLFKKK